MLLNFVIFFTKKNRNWFFFKFSLCRLIFLFKRGILGRRALMFIVNYSDHATIPTMFRESEKSLFEMILIRHCGQCCRIVCS